MRGMNIDPHAAPAQLCATRIQHDDFEPLCDEPRSSGRSQWKRTRTRPWKSVEISSSSSPGAAITSAVCGPCTSGRGVSSSGRMGVSEATHSKVFQYRVDTAEPPDGMVSVSASKVRSSDFTCSLSRMSSGMSPQAATWCCTFRST